LQKLNYIILIIALLFAGCATSRKKQAVNTSTAPGAVDARSIESVLLNNLSNRDFFIQKADINIIQNNVSVRFSASIKFRMPDTLLITVKSKSGIEAGRALITQDTIQIIDRINKQYFIGSPEAIGQKYGIEPSLLFVLFGDVILSENDRKAVMNCTKGFYKSEFGINGKTISYTIDCIRQKAAQAYFEGDLKSGNITMLFSDIVREGKLIFPRKIKMQDDLNSLEVNLEIKKIESPWNGKLSFNKGSGYRTIKIR
jgi:hypothetical protein